MADTSLIFNIIAKDSGLGRALDKVAGAFRGAGRDAEQALDRASSSTDNLDRQIEEAQSRVRSLAEEFDRTGDRRLFGAISRDRSLISNLEKVRGALRGVDSDSRNTDTAATGLSGTLARLGGAAAGVGGTVASLGGSLMSSLSSVVGLTVALGALAGALFVSGGAVGVFGGAMAAIPGMVSGAIAAVATLKLGLFGLGENWKAMNTSAGGGGGGGGGVQDMTPKLRAVEAAQRQVARSARDITDAQEALREATRGVNEAREEERERIEDVRRSLASARADEADSVQSLAEARMQLALAEQRGNPDEIRRAQIAVDKQAASLEEAKDKTQDLQKEADEAGRKGVEGSTAVVTAKKRERDAQRRVTDAVEQHKLAIQQLGDAQKALAQKMAGGGGGGGLAKELPKISRSAQEFLNVLKELKPAFEDLRLSVQERLFSGLADKMRTLANVWIPQLKISLGNMADTINGIVKTAFDSLSKPSFVRNMATAVEGFRAALGDVGEAIAGPLVDAWGRLSAASVPVMEVIGEKLAGIITHFSDWIAKIDESGELDAFMQDAAEIFGHVLDIFEDLGRIAGSVMSILFGTESGDTDNWESLANAVDDFADWIGNPEVQQNISDFVDGLLAVGYIMIWVATKIDDFIEWVGGLDDAIKDFVKNAGRWLRNLPSVIGSALSAAARTMVSLVVWGVQNAGRILASLPRTAWNVLRNLPSTIYNIFRNVGSNIYNALSNVPNLLWAAGYNAIIGLWNGISSLGGWLYSRVANFVRNNIVNPARDFLRIGSPSKVMADLGQWVPMGLAQGIDQKTPAVRAAAERMAGVLANTRMAVGGLDMGQLDQAVLAATGTVQVTAARRKPQTVNVNLNVNGADGEMKTMIRKMIRTGNLLQDKG